MPAASVTRHVADRVRSLRSERGWSAQQLANECARVGMPSLSRGTIAKIESGVRKSITAEEVAVLADVLGVTPTSLLAAGSVPVPAAERSRGRHVAGELGLRRVSEWDPIRLGVHRVESERLGMEGLLPYIRRRHDGELHTLLRRVATGSTMALLVGKSATGKTRSLYEAAMRCLPDWFLFFPPTAAELVDAQASGLIRPGTVVWLDEIQSYFNGPVGAQAAAAVRSLLLGNEPVTVLATIQSEYWAALITPPQEKTSDPGAYARDVLMASDVVQVADVLDAEEMAAASELAARVPLLAAAEKAAPDGRVIPVLATAPILITRYEHASNPYGEAILTAAIDAYRLGHLKPLLPKFLQEAAPAYLNDAQRVAPSAWFENGLQYATAPVIGGISALSAVRTRPGIGPPDGYLLQDFLADYGKAVRNDVTVPERVWEALAAYTADPDDRRRLAIAAEQRSLDEYRIRFQSTAPDATWAEELATEARLISDAINETMQCYVATGRLAPSGLVETEDLAPELARANVKLMIAEVKSGSNDDSSLQSLSLACMEDPELFFAESPEDVEAAKLLCHQCPVRIHCLTGALERREPWGVWGGELLLRGTIVPRKRVRGRERPRRREAS